MRARTEMRADRRELENVTFTERPPERIEEEAEPAKEVNGPKYELQKQSKTKMALVLRRRSAD